MRDGVSENEIAGVFRRSVPMLLSWNLKKKKVCYFWSQKLAIKYEFFSLQLILYKLTPPTLRGTSFAVAKSGDGPTRESRRGPRGQGLGERRLEPGPGSPQLQPPAEPSPVSERNSEVTETERCKIPCNTGRSWLPSLVLFPRKWRQHQPLHRVRNIALLWGLYLEWPTFSKGVL